MPILRKYFFFYLIFLNAFIIDGLSQNRGTIIENVNIINPLPAKALLIANSNYVDEKWPDLSNPRKDIDRLYSILISKYQFDSSEVMILIDATKTDMSKAFRTMSTHSGDLLVFYAGHGGLREGEEESYIVPKDFSFEDEDYQITYDKIINTWLTTKDSSNQKIIKMKHLLFVSDACYSGMGLSRVAAAHNSRGYSNSENYDTEYLYTKKALFYMSSAGDKQTPDNSQFFKYFSKILEENEDQTLTSETIYNKIGDLYQSNNVIAPKPYRGILNANFESIEGDFVFFNKTVPTKISNSPNVVLPIVESKNQNQNLGQGKSLYSFRGIWEEKINDPDAWYKIEKQVKIELLKNDSTILWTDRDLANKIIDFTFSFIYDKKQPKIKISCRYYGQENDEPKNKIDYLIPEETDDWINAKKAEDLILTNEKLSEQIIDKMYALFKSISRQN